jgi:anti-anti-sigma factor
MFDIEIGTAGNVKLVGRLDAAEADRAQQIFRGFNHPLTADFSDLEYISSAGIAVLIETYKRLTAAGHAFRLTNMKPRVRNVFTYAGLDRLLQIE